jgi:hypothetical protein
MKTAFILLTVLSSIAFANVRPAGTFVSSQCSFSNSLYKVCFGRISQVPGEYVLVVEGRVNTTYRILSRTPGNGGINPSAAVEDLYLRAIPSGAATHMKVNYSGNKITSATIPNRNPLVVVSDFQPVVLEM